MPTKIDVGRLGKAKGVGAELAAAIAELYPTYEALAEATAADLAAMVEGINDESDPRAKAAITFAKMMAAHGATEEPKKAAVQPASSGLSMAELRKRAKGNIMLEPSLILANVQSSEYAQAMETYESNQPASLGYQVANAVAADTGRRNVIAIERRTRRISKPASAARMRRLMDPRTRAKALTETTVTFEGAIFDLIDLGAQPGVTYPRDPAAPSLALDENNMGAFEIMWGPLGEANSIKDEVRFVLMLACRDTAECRIDDAAYRETVVVPRLNPDGNPNSALTADNFNRLWPKAVALYFQRASAGGKDLPSLTISAEELMGQTEQSNHEDDLSKMKRKLRGMTMRSFKNALERFNTIRQDAKGPLKEATADAYRILYTAILMKEEPDDFVYQAIVRADEILTQARFTPSMFSEIVLVS